MVRRDATIVFGTFENLDIKCSGAQVDECSVEKMLSTYVVLNVCCKPVEDKLDEKSFLLLNLFGICMVLLDTVLYYKAECFFNPYSAYGKNHHRNNMIRKNPLNWKNK